MRSRIDLLTLADLVTRLAHNEVVEDILYLGSSRHGALHPASDHDLLVIIAEMPVPLQVLLTTPDSRLTDVLFAPSVLFDLVVAG